MSTPRIALISGSIRTGSINRTHVKAFVHLFRDAGANPVTLDLNDYPMPLYNGDWEAEHGPPKTTKNLILRLKRYDGVFISTPEYNGCIPPLLKNTIDWTTRIELGHFTGPVYGIGAASPGRFSGIMALRELRFLLARLGATVVPAQIGTGFGADAFDKSGRFKSERKADFASKLVSQMLTEISRRR